MVFFRAHVKEAIVLIFFVPEFIFDHFLNNILFFCPVYVHHRGISNLIWDLVLIYGVKVKTFHEYILVIQYYTLPLAESQIIFLKCDRVIRILGGNFMQE